MKTIILTQGYTTYVDDEDYPYLSQFNWQYSQGYAKRTVRNGKKFETVRMHRVILNAPEGYQVDHVDGNRCNNQRSNLRLCLMEQNRKNRRPNQSSVSRYKGVKLNRYTGKWFASIGVNGTKHHLGTFCTEEEAALAYDSAAKQYHGEFARPNFK